MQSKSYITVIKVQLSTFSSFSTTLNAPNWREWTQIKCPTKNKSYKDRNLVYTLIRKPKDKGVEYAKTAKKETIKLLSENVLLRIGIYFRDTSCSTLY